MYMYIAIKYRTYNRYDIVEYRTIKQVDEDIKLWKDIKWAYVYERLTGKVIHCLTPSAPDGKGWCDENVGKTLRDMGKM